MKQLFILVGILALLSLYKCDPQPPIWADQWQQNFTDSSVFDGELWTTKGYYLYDYPNKRENVWREDCRADAVTKDMFTEKTSCSQFVSGHKRYIYQDQTDECCFCTYRSVLKPDWSRQAGGKWKGYELRGGQFYNTFLTWVYEPYAAIYNAYNVETNIQAALYRPDYFEKKMIYDENSYQEYISNPQDLELPQSCKPKKLAKCPGGCAFMRHDVNHTAQF